MELQGLHLTTAPKSSEVEPEGAVVTSQGHEAVLALVHSVEKDPAVVPREDEPEPPAEVNVEAGQQTEDEAHEQSSEVEDE